MKKIFSRIHSVRWFPNVIALFAGIVYSLQLWIYAHTQTSMVDEGGYLYIGYLFAKGTYRPFQDYGPWMYNAPLSYLIPGYIQYWFGPGLRTGRYFAMFLAILMLVALWITARRLGGKWWAAAIVWAVALNPIPLRDLSIGVSQGLVACLLALTLMFVLGERRSLWQILASSFLAGITVMTRHNMLPLVPLLVAYVFWQHGRKLGWWSLIVSLIPIFYVHAIYWPNILCIWAMWVPEKIAPFLAPFRQPTAEPSYLLVEDRLMAFLMGIRFHYMEFVGALAAVLLWPRASDWKSKANMRAAFFLASLFGALLLLHAGFSLVIRNAYTCAYCFTPYITFFGITALLLIVVSFASWKREVSIARFASIVIFILFLIIGLGYTTSAESIARGLPEWLFAIRIPHVRRNISQWFPGSRLGDLLVNFLGYEQAVALFYAAIILTCVSMSILLLSMFYHWLRRKKAITFSFGYLILATALGLGYFLSPVMVGRFREQPECSIDVIRAYENIGQQLAEIIPSGGQVYWNVSNDVPLLYVSDFNIHPAQLFAGHSYKYGGNAEQLLRFGLWNDEVGSQWREEADFLVIDDVWFRLHGMDQVIDQSRYIKFQTAPLNPCDEKTRLYIYQQKP